MKVPTASIFTTCAPAGSGGHREEDTAPCWLRPPSGPGAQPRLVLPSLPSTNPGAPEHRAASQGHPDEAAGAEDRDPTWRLSS